MAEEEKKRKQAIAIQYNPDEAAPKILASGTGIIADKILEKAEDNDVPVVYNKELTDLLCNVDVGDSIPTEVYDAVAHIIAYITELDSSL